MKEKDVMQGCSNNKKQQTKQKNDRKEQGGTEAIVKE